MGPLELAKDYFQRARALVSLSLAIGLPTQTRSIPALPRTPGLTSTNLTPTRIRSLAVQAHLRRRRRTQRPSSSDLRLSQRNFRRSPLAISCMVLDEEAVNQFQSEHLV